MTISQSLETALKISERRLQEAKAYWDAVSVPWRDEELEERLTRRIEVLREMLELGV